MWGCQPWSTIAMLTKVQLHAALWAATDHTTAILIMRHTPVYSTLCDHVAAISIAQLLTRLPLCRHSCRQTGLVAKAEVLSSWGHAHRKLTA